MKKKTTNLSTSLFNHLRELRQIVPAHLKCDGQIYQINKDEDPGYLQAAYTLANLISLFPSDAWKEDIDIQPMVQVLFDDVDRRLKWAVDPVNKDRVVPGELEVLQATMKYLKAFDIRQSPAKKDQTKG